MQRCFFHPDEPTPCSVCANLCPVGHQLEDGDCPSCENETDADVARLGLLGGLR